ncbi:MAG: AgmX/PglI C-terminal domain-containing protein [Myxococcota bacterium]
MKFLCGSCRTKYQISDEKVRGKILTIRCKKCGAKIIVRESLSRDGGEGTIVAPVAEEPRSTPFNPRIKSGSGALSQAFSQALESGTQDVPIDSERPPTAFEWFTAVDGQQQGPFSYDHVANQVRSGALQGRHYVWHEGMEHWRRIRDVEQLRRLAESSTSPPPPPPADRSLGLELDKTTAEPEVAPMAGIAASELPTTASASTLFGDGTTASAGADPLAAGQAPSASAQELDELSDAEDLFANVPRATEAELVQKESTRFFVNAAGVRGIKNLNRLGLILGAALFLLLGGLVTGAATGVIEIHIPGFGNPFAGDEDGVALLSGEGDDPNALKFLGEEKKPKPKSRRSRSGGRPQGGPPGGEDGFDFAGEYIEDGEGQGGPRGGRGLEGASFEIGDVTTGGGVKASSVGDSDLPSSGGPEVPVVATRTLSDEAIQRTVNARKQSVKICYERSLKGQGGLGGKLEVRVRVEPSGQVSKTSIDTPQFRSSRIGKCIADKIRDWRFPPFEGEAEEVVVPFLLARSSY